VGTPPKEGKCKKIIIFNGTPEEIVRNKKSHTAQFLRKELS
jgi:excinuclease UvrABC ATPase subunit